MHFSNEPLHSRTCRVSGIFYCWHFSPSFQAMKKLTPFWSTVQCSLDQRHWKLCWKGMSTTWSICGVQFFKFALGMRDIFDLFLGTLCNSKSSTALQSGCISFSEPEANRHCSKLMAFRSFHFSNFNTWNGPCFIVIFLTRVDLTEFLHSSLQSLRARWFDGTCFWRALLWQNFCWKKTVFWRESISQNFFENWHFFDPRWFGGIFQETCFHLTRIDLTEFLMLGRSTNVLIVALTYISCCQWFCFDFKAEDLDDDDEGWQPPMALARGGYSNGGKRSRYLSPLRLKRSYWKCATTKDDRTR